MNIRIRIEGLDQFTEALALLTSAVGVTKDTSFTAPAPVTPAQEVVAPEISEDFRVEVRKTLAKLNKKVGKNTASDLIKEFGVKKLTEVKLEDLPALMDKAKEALNAE